jgi:hypothetical protein
MRIFGMSGFLSYPLGQRGKSNYPSLLQKFMCKPLSHAPKFKGGALSKVMALPPDQRL